MVSVIRAPSTDEIVTEPLLSKSRGTGAEPEPDKPLPVTSFPNASFTYARKNALGRSLPQAIAHRGYKSEYPENTMAAFKGAVQVGVDAIETDIHLTQDDVVVLSHDATLKRCFGLEGKVIDHTWDFLKDLRTVKEPRQPMPRLLDLLEFLTEPGLEKTWVLLDIKLDNDINDVMRLIAETIRQVTPARGAPWEKRIVLGIWGAKYLPLCAEHLPGYPITHIGKSLIYASRFFSVPNVSFNLLWISLIPPWSFLFLRAARRQKRPVYAWTVNHRKVMQWCIRRDFDGVITDDPKLFLDVRESWREGGSQERFSLLDYLNILRWAFFATYYLILSWYKYGFGVVDRRFKRSFQKPG